MRDASFSGPDGVDVFVAYGQQLYEACALPLFLAEDFNQFDAINTAAFEVE